MYKTLTILKKRQSLLEAQQMAYQEFMPFFTMWHDYVVQMTNVPLRELYVAEGLNAWLIRVEIEAREKNMAEIEQWVTEHIQSDDPRGFAGTPVWERG